MILSINALKRDHHASEQKQKRLETSGSLEQMSKARTSLAIAWLPFVLVVLVFAVPVLLYQVDMLTVCEQMNPPNGKEFLCGNSGYAAPYVQAIKILSLVSYLFAIAYLARVGALGQYRFAVAISTVVTIPATIIWLAALILLGHGP